jgi:TruD family tRNA pseudouridine synthase
MPLSHADQSIWERERAFLDLERAAKPELFKTDPEARKTVLPSIGITTLHPDLPTGYIRYSPLDFLVEEIAAKDDVVEILPGPKSTASSATDTGTIYADLVKIAISTLDAVQRVVDALKLQPDQVKYAGIKDAVAVTAQRISIRGAQIQNVIDMRAPNLILKNIREGKGALATGALEGNRFSLFVRVGPKFDPIVFSNRLSDVNHYGVINYYGPQRFGAPRYLSHLFGLHLLRGDLEGLLRTVFCGASPTELAYHAGLRTSAESVYGDWKAMRQIFETLPYSFRHELTMLATLERGGKPADAVFAVSQQANLWARAYASYLANHLLSEWGRDPQHMPKDLPLLLSMDPAARLIYEPALKAHGTDRFMEHLRPFRFINIGRNPVITTRVFPNMRGVKTVKEGVAISFELPKAAYATTVLMHLFDAITGSPIPDWIQPEEVDTKEILGLGTMSEIRIAFRKELDLMASMRSNESEEAEV